MCDVNAFDFLSGRSFVGRPLPFFPRRQHHKIFVENETHYSCHRFF